MWCWVICQINKLNDAVLGPAFGAIIVVLSWFYYVPCNTPLGYHGYHVTPPPHTQTHPVCPQPYLQSILLILLLRWLEIRYSGRTLKTDQLCRSVPGGPAKRGWGLGWGYDRC